MGWSPTPGQEPNLLQTPRLRQEEAGAAAWCKGDHGLTSISEPIRSVCDASRDQKADSTGQRNVGVSSASEEDIFPEGGIVVNERECLLHAALPCAVQVEV